MCTAKITSKQIGQIEEGATNLAPHIHMRIFFLYERLKLIGQMLLTTYVAWLHISVLSPASPLAFIFSPGGYKLKNCGEVDGFLQILNCFLTQTCFSVSSKSVRTRTPVRSDNVMAVGICVTRRLRGIAFVDVCVYKGIFVYKLMVSYH